MIANKRFFILFLLLILYKAVSLSGQETPTIGLSLDKHVGPVLYKSVSVGDNMIVTVSEDRTLKVWEYPSYKPIKSINMPESQGNSTRLGLCAILNKNTVLVAEDSGNDYEYRPSSNYDKQTPLVKFGRHGMEIDYYTFKNVKTNYCFYAVDLQKGMIVDRVDAMSSPISGFFFSPDKSTLLVTSREQAMIYDIGSLRLINEITYNDEEILGVTFISQNEFVIITDLYFYKYELHRFIDASFADRKQVVKKRLHPIVGRKNVKRAVFSSDGQYVYLFHEEGFLYAINTTTGVVVEDVLPIGYKEIIEPINYPDSSVIYVDGIKTDVVAVNKKKKRELKRIWGEFWHTYEIAPSVEETIPDSVFLYRDQAAPFVRLYDKTLYMVYDNNVWKLSDKNGISLANSSEAEKILKEQGKKSHIIVESHFSSYEDEIRALSPHIEIWDRLFHINGDSKRPEVSMYNGWKKTLPASAEMIYNWVTPFHFLLSLNDGTIRWYNTRTGEEELALFISKNNDWIIWTPDGRYDESSPKAGNMIEWHYQTFSRVNVRKPMDNRRAFYRPNAIKNILDQLFNHNGFNIDTRIINSPDSIAIIDNVSTDQSGHYLIDYSLIDYNPDQYGPYEISLYLDDSFCTNYIHTSNGNHGQINAVAKAGAGSVDIVLKTAYKGVFAPATYDIKKSIYIDSLWITSIGVNKYEHYEYPNLKAAINDANDVKDLFNNLTIGGAEWKDICLLQDNELTSNRLNKRFDDILSVSKDKALSLFFFSGHGKSKSGEYYIVTSTGDLINLTRLIEKCSKTDGKFIFIVDACFSGQLAKKSYNNVALITSSDADSKSLDGRDELSESLFTGILKKQLNGIQTSITLDELFSQLSISSISADIKPQFNNNIGNIKIIKQ